VASAPDLALAVNPSISITLPEGQWWRILGISGIVDASATIAAGAVKAHVLESATNAVLAAQEASMGVAAWDSSFFFGKDADRKVPGIDTDFVLAPFPTTPFRGAGCRLLLTFQGGANNVSVQSIRVIAERVDV